jgi:MFS family permease
MDKVSGRAWFTALALLLAYILSFADRTILSLLLEPIKQDLQISDLQVSLLLGFAFALLYTVLGIPVGILADRGNRKRIIFAGMALWTLATASCGLARAYIPLFASRVAVGIGEACLGPSANSLMADLFPRRLLGRALAIYNSGIYVGSGGALLIGGGVTAAILHSGPLTLPLLGQLQAWQAAFLVMGLIGMPFVALIGFIPEPPRQAAPREKVSLAALGEHAGRTKRFLFCFTLGMMVVSLGGYAYLSWTPTIFIRIHHWPLHTTGLVIGTIVVLVGTLSVMLGSRIAELWDRRGAKDAILRVMAIAAAGEGLGGMLVASESDALALLGFGFAIVFSAMPVGIAHAALQLTTPPRLRAKVTSVFMLFNNLIGLGAGPVLVAYTTEHLYGSPLALGRSVATVGFGVCALACALFLLARRPYRAALERQEAAIEGDRLSAERAPA